MTAPARAALARHTLSPVGIARQCVSRLDGPALRRMLLAGAAWGVTVSLGLTAARAWRCGELCLDAAAIDAVITAAIGTVTVGPLALLRRSPDAPRARSNHEPGRRHSSPGNLCPVRSISDRRL